MKHTRFKKGDRVTFPHWNDGTRCFGVVKSARNGALQVTVDGEDYEDYAPQCHNVNSHLLHTVELESVYNSPLYQALM